MDEEDKADRRGTWRDWPAELAILAAILWLLAPAAAVLWLLLIGFAVVAWLIRAGAFTPRR